MSIKDSIADSDLESLRAAIDGQVFVPGLNGYDQARQTWNLTVDERPSIVVIATSASDVAEAVRYARTRGMRISPQGTGHGGASISIQPPTCWKGCLTSDWRKGWAERSYSKIGSVGQIE